MMGDHQERVHHEEGHGEIFQDAGEGGHLLLHHRVGQQIGVLPDEDETAGLVAAGAPDGSGAEGKGRPMGQRVFSRTGTCR